MLAVSSLVYAAMDTVFFLVLISLGLAELRILLAAPVDTCPRTSLISFCTVQLRTLCATRCLVTLCLFTTSGPDPGELPGFCGFMVCRHAPIPRKGSGNQSTTTGKLKFCGYILRTDNRLKKVIMQGMVEGKRRLGRPRKRFLDEIMEELGPNLESTLKLGTSRSEWRKAAPINSASTWCCSPQCCLGWVEMAVGHSKSPSYPKHFLCTNHFLIVLPSE